MDTREDRIALRDGRWCVALDESLTDQLHAAILESGSDLARWMGWWHPGFTRDETAAWVAFCKNAWTRGTHFEFAVTDGTTYLGSCALTTVDLNAGTANLAYWTRSAAAGQGIASSAARAISAWGVAAHALRRIDIAMATANVASRRVAERAGGVLEGFLRNRVRVRGRSYNYALFALTPEDFHEDEL